jgi:hypothetical protein
VYEVRKPRKSGVFCFGRLPQVPKISDPTGGTTIDTQARTAIVAILKALSAASGVGITA